MSDADGAGSPAEGGIQVSVVVPVYNPRQYLDATVESLLAQTIAPEAVELIFVDDVSTDGSGAKLDQLAERHQQVRVIHREVNSGWSGTPRNDGINAARGEYVQFMDQDDLLGREALERLYARARLVDADIVIGRSEGFGRKVAVDLFTRDRLLATLEDSPIIESLTPHKMFRRAFLNEHGLRFPEGRRRLEDHPFVTRAYFLAERISVLGDYVCYFHVARDDKGNAAFERLDPEGYFGNMRDALDVVDEFTTPGPFRDAMMRRWLNSGIVRRARGRSILGPSPEYRHQLVSAMHRLVVERIPEGADAGLLPVPRVAAASLRAGDEERLVALAQWEVSVKMSAVATRLEWVEGGLHLTVTCRYGVGAAPRGSERPTFLVRDLGDGRHRLDVPRELLPEGHDESLLEWDGAVAGAYIIVRSRNHIDRARHPASVSLRRVPVPGHPDTWTPEVVVELTFDPGARTTDTAFPDGPLDLYTEVRFAGLSRTPRLAAGRLKLRAAAQSPPPHVLRPYRTEQGNLSVMLNRPVPHPSLPQRARGRARRLVRSLPRLGTRG
jgi:hypothetical protein